jgi:hypothetical protein
VKVTIVNVRNDINPLLGLTYYFRFYTSHCHSFSNMLSLLDIYVASVSYDALGLFILIPREIENVS